VINPAVLETVGGSADLTGSNNTQSHARVVSVPSMELFEKQSKACKATVFGSEKTRISIEASIRQGRGEGGQPIAKTSPLLASRGEAGVGPAHETAQL
jgi:transketolase